MKAKRTPKNCNTCKWAETNPNAPLPFGPRGDQLFDLECMHPEGETEGEDDAADEPPVGPVQQWADENLHEGWCLKSADGCPGHEEHDAL